LTQSIQNLSKVAVTLRAGKDRDTLDLTSNPVFFDFIYGVGKEGFCAFESALYGKLVGEKSMMTITADEAGEILGHMRMQICSSLGIAKITEPFFLETTVTGVSQADNRELVQAIAKAASQGGCGGNCDCGC
jgi:hypothetical protein